MPNQCQEALDRVQALININIDAIERSDRGLRLAAEQIDDDDITTCHHAIECAITRDSQFLLLLTQIHSHLANLVNAEEHRDAQRTTAHNATHRQIYRKDRN